MPLWLHPSHLKSGSISPLKLSGDERSRGERLASSLTWALETDTKDARSEAKLKMSSQEFDQANLTTVQFLDGFLTCEGVSVPLLCADMAWLDHDSPGLPFDRAETEERKNVHQRQDRMTTQHIHIYHYISICVKRCDTSSYYSCVYAI